MMSGSVLKNTFEADSYEISLNYLRSEGADKIGFPIQVRERHLTNGETKCQMQAIGPELQLAIWSDRDNIAIRIPLKEWHTAGPYVNKFVGANNGYLSAGRFEDVLEFDETDDGYEVSGVLFTHDWDKPSDRL